nr:EOG090X0ALT [Megafenestra aurita]
MAATVQISSFQKRVKPSTSSIAGTKISSTNGTLHVSSGIPSLDNICDGGFPMGSLSLIEEDIYGSYAKIITKYFLAEGALNKNYLFAASLNENPSDILNNLPSPTSSDVQEKRPIENTEELKIAWRYENLSLGDSNERTGNIFDLSVPYIIKFFSHNVFILICNTGTLKNQSCLSLLTTINQIINNWELDSKNSSNLLRIVVSSFGSPHWNFSEKEISTDFTATLFLLKSLIRSANVVAVITIPHQLLNASSLLVARSRSAADMVFQLKSLREDPNLRDLMDVHGILEMKKLANLTSLKPILGQDGTTTYGFKATKRKFKIEKLHVPPSLEENKSSANDLSTAGCASSSSRNNLDF